MPLRNRILCGLAILTLTAAGWWWRARESSGDPSTASRPPVAGPAMAAPRGPDTAGDPASAEGEEPPPPSRKDWLGDNGDVPFALRAKYGDEKVNRLSILMATVLSGWNVPREDAEILHGPTGDVRVWLPPRILPGGMTKSDYLDKLNDILGEQDAEEYRKATSTFITLRTGHFGEHGRLLLARGLSAEQSLLDQFQFAEYLTQDPGWKSDEERRESLSNHMPGGETKVNGLSPVLLGRNVYSNRIPEDFAPYFEYLDGGIAARAPK